MSDFILGLSVGGMAGFVLGMVVLVNAAEESTYPVNKSQWHCTASRVVNDTLPKVEECVKYERKE